ncbi:hypothetical protein [Amantichitinum ursilacus]|uniref:hypothetical protein n=1 Tax=Amantichitinum ursilacus TaxID=857265 RepID=UPI0006B658C4|nr:hypothetical protein [Amantichitinum ursilacus]
MNTYRVCDYLPGIGVGSKYELLFYCVSFALYAASSPLDRHLKGILIEDEFAPSGGDPGWSLNIISDADSAIRPDLWKQHLLTSAENDSTCYEAWADSATSGIPEEAAYYTICEVRKFILMALQNIALKHPHRANEVNQIIAAYDLK